MFAAVAIPVVLGGLAVGTDIWTVVSAHRHMQDRVDAAAVAAASAPRTESEARRRALANAALSGRRSDITLTDTSLETGRYFRDGTFTTESDVKNGVHVTADADVRLTFGRLVGLDSAPIRVEAYAWYVAFDCKIFVDSLAQFRGNVAGDGWNSCNEGFYTTGTEDVALCSNGDVELSGSGTYDGDINVGGTLTLGGSASYTGDSSTIDYPIEFPDFSSGALAASISNDNGPLPRRLRLSGGDIVTIGPGTFYFEDIQITGGTTVVLEPPIDVYLDGDLRVGGSSSIVTGSPTVDQVNIYVTSGSKLDIRGTADIYGTLLAPEATIDVGGTAAFYGLFMADEVYGRGTVDFHTDVCLDFADHGLALEDQPTAPRLVNVR